MRKSLAVLAVLALVAAGCGGSKSGSAAGGASGATVAPEDALAFLSVNTDEGSDQWQQADALLKKFPIRSRLLAQINDALSDEGVDFNADIRPLLGPELDFVVLSGAAAGPQLVGMTQSTDAEKFGAALERGSNPSVHTEVDGWTVFSDTQAALDAFKAAKAKLADDASFKDATAGLPAETNVTAYVNGREALGLLQQSVPQLGPLPTGQVQWLGVALSSQADAVKVDGAVKSSQSAGANFKATFLSKVPSTAIVVASFHGSAQLEQQLTRNPAVGQAAPQLQQLLGVGLTDLAGLIQGEGVLFVAPGIPFPEVTVILEQAKPAVAIATLNKVAARLAVAFHGSLTEANRAGTIKKLRLGPIAIYYGISGRTVVISDSIASLTAGRGTPITDDPVFKKAKAAAGLPDESAGFVYVNLKQAIPAIEGLATSAGEAVARDLAENLAPLESFFAYTTSSGGIAKFTVLLQIH